MIGCILIKFTTAEQTVRSVSRGKQSGSSPGSSTAGCPSLEAETEFSGGAKQVPHLQRTRVVVSSEVE